PHCGCRRSFSWPHGMASGRERFSFSEGNYLLVVGIQAKDDMDDIKPSPVLSRKAAFFIRKAVALSRIKRAVFAIRTKKPAA
ncbi:hypothetical protein, partial [Siphonobacter sp. BAB-5385]|uniref:hypothetical protein n=1 Tax=Siphonobacter sp. BAB-5385 TaxID=1864822 RepID=UPI001C3E58C2